MRKSFHLGLVVVLSWTASSQAADRDMADSFRRMVFMLNLDPVPWSQAWTEYQAVAASLDPDGGEDGLLARGEAKYSRLAKERSISLPTPMMHRQTAKSLMELATDAIARALIDAPRDELPALWAALEPEVSLYDPEAIDRFSALIHESDFEGLKAFRDYVQINFIDGFSIIYHGAFRPVPVTARENVSGPTPKPALPPGTFLNPGADVALAELKKNYGDWRDESLEPFEVGLIAFHDPSIFGEPGRSMGMSCASCHAGSLPNQEFFIPGLSIVHGGADVTNSYFGRFNNNKAFDPLDIPGLEGLRHTGPFGRNGRFENMGQVVRNVIVMEFDGEEPSQRLIDGIVAFMASFEFPENPALNENGTLSASAPEAAHRGEALFKRRFEQMEGRSCATCHVPSIYFLDRQKHDIGTIPPGSPYAPDGKLDTPTLLGVVRSAPYFHDGRADTLADAVDWFVVKFDLGLATAEKADLTAYIEIVGGANVE